MRAGVRYASTPMMGLMSCALAWRQKSKATKEEAVVTGRHGLHAEFFSVGEQVAQARGTVEHRVLGVHVQVRKFFWLPRESPGGMGLEDGR